ncbi:MAG TPA: VOC family protein [Candidatus Saccharimonadia bacterium]|nr:VOC family protein [Candidatus Saccharimonadia bacterium]
MQKITPSLWFDNNCEEAINYYTSVFKNSKIISIKHYPEGIAEGPMAGMGGKVLTGIFELNGQRFMALDGGPIFKFNESVSFQVECEDQEEVDYFWDKLSAVPESEQCGWVKDKFGLSWQIIPKQMGDLLNDPDAEKAGRVLQAMLQMKKIVIADLEAAASSN